MMKKQIFFLLMYIFCGLSAFGYEQYLSVEKTINGFNMTVPIDALFEGRCLSCSGQKLLLDIKEKISYNYVFIECYTDRKLFYNASWELADVYAYDVVIFLIKSGINPRKLTYIGYGNMSVYSDEPNRIVFNVIK